MYFEALLNTYSYLTVDLGIVLSQRCYQWVAWRWVLGVDGAAEAVAISPQTPGQRTATAPSDALLSDRQRSRQPRVRTTLRKSAALPGRGAGAATACAIRNMMYL